MTTVQELELSPTTTRKRVSPEEYVHLYESDRRSIVSSRFIAPRLGDDHFGHVEVVLRGAFRQLGQQRR